MIPLYADGSIFLEQNPTPHCSYNHYALTIGNSEFDIVVTKEETKISAYSPRDMALLSRVPAEVFSLLKEES